MMLNYTIILLEKYIQNHTYSLHPQIKPIIMFRPQLILENRWRLEHHLPDLEQISRWVAWDLRTEVFVEILAPTPVENLKPQQPQFFFDIHSKREHCISVQQSEGTYFAVYPLPHSEFKVQNRLPLQSIQSFIVETSKGVASYSHPIFPCEFIQYTEGGPIEHRPLGMYFSLPKIELRPLYNPQKIEDTAFSLAMMVLCNQVPQLSWSSRKSFESWIVNQEYLPYTATFPNQFREWIACAMTGTPLNTLSRDKQGVHLSPLVYDNAPLDVHPSSPPTSTQPKSSASQDIPLPKYLLIAECIPSPSVAKQIAALTDTQPEVLLNAFEDKTAFPIAGSDSQQELQRLQESFHSIAVTLQVEDSRGFFGKPIIRWTKNIAILSGTGLWFGGFGVVPLVACSIGWVILSHLSTQQHVSIQKQWKLARSVGQQTQNKRTLALQRARKRILSSNEPKLAVLDLLTQVDELDENTSLPEQIVIDTANKIYPHTAFLDTTLSKRVDESNALLASIHPPSS